MTKIYFNLVLIDLQCNHVESTIMQSSNLSSVKFLMNLKHKIAVESLSEINMLYLCFEPRKLYIPLLAAIYLPLPYQ